MSDSPQHQPGQPYAQPGQPYAQPGQPYAQPGQPYAQPAQPGQPYAQPGQPYAQPGQPYGQAPGMPPATVTPVSGATVGRIAFLVTVISVGPGLLLQLAMPFLYASTGMGGVDTLPSLVNFAMFAGSVVGLVLGLTALRRSGPHLLAAIAIGIAGSTILGTLASGLTSLVYNFGSFGF